MSEATVLDRVATVNGTTSSPTWAPRNGLSDVPRISSLSGPSSAGRFTGRASAPWRR